jgi:hypothetical protein
VHIVEFTAGSLRFVDTVPAQPPADGFVWVYLERAEYAATLPEQQALAQRLGGSALLDLHARDLANEAHPSHFDATSVYDRVIFRRLATAEEARATAAAGDALDAAARIDSRAVGFAVFDGLLVSVHPAGCPVAVGFIERLATDARLSVDAASALAPAAKPGRPGAAADQRHGRQLPGLRKALTRRLEAAQHLLLRQRPAAQAWPALMQARQQLGWLQELCEEQQDAMQEWLDALREQPLADWGADTALALHRRDGLVRAPAT